MVGFPARALLRKPKGFPNSVTNNIRLIIQFTKAQILFPFILIFLTHCGNVRKQYQAIQNKRISVVGGTNMYMCLNMFTKKCCN